MYPPAKSSAVKLKDTSAVSERAETPVSATTDALQSLRRARDRMLKDENGTPRGLTVAQGLMGIITSIVAILGFILPSVISSHDEQLRLTIRMANTESSVIALQTMFTEDRKSRLADHDLLVLNAAQTQRIINWIDSGTGGSLNKKPPN